MPDVDAGPGTLSFWKNLALQNRVLWTALAALCFLLLSALVPYWGGLRDPARGILSGGFRDLGLALVIAIAVSLSIEVIARRELDKLINEKLTAFGVSLDGQLSEFRNTADQKIAAISNDVFRGVLLRKFPRKIREEIETVILSSDFVREGYHSNYFLAVRDGHSVGASAERMMHVTAFTTYSVLNIASQPRDYPLQIFLEETPIPGLDAYPCITEVMVGDKSALDDAVVVRSGGFVGFTHIIRGIDSLESITIKTRFEFLKFLDDYEIWTMAAPSDGMHLTVHFPDEVKQWDGFSIHREDLKKDKNANVVDFRLPAPMLPKQGIVIWWRCGER